MKIEIRNALNGIVLSVDLERPGDPPEEIAYQSTDDGEVEAFADFLRYVLEHYRPGTSRYSPKRIYVLVEPGGKFEGPAEEPLMS